MTWIVVQQRGQPLRTAGVERRVQTQPSLFGRSIARGIRKQLFASFGVTQLCSQCECALACVGQASPQQQRNCGTRCKAEVLAQAEYRVEHRADSVRQDRIRLHGLRIFQRAATAQKTRAIGLVFDGPLSLQVFFVASLNLHRMRSPDLGLTLRTLAPCGKQYTVLCLPFGLHEHLGKRRMRVVG